MLAIKSMRSFKVAACITMIVLSGCANVPPEAASANQRISDGVTRMESDTQAVLEAWRQTLSLAVEAELDTIYDRAEVAVRTHAGLAAGVPLTLEQQKDVTGLTVIIMLEANNRIGTKISELSATVRTNAATVRNANGDITQLLSSASRIGLARAEIISTLGELIPLPDISGIVEAALGAATSENIVN